MVGLKDFHQHARGGPWASYLFSPAYIRLQPVEGSWATEAGHCRIPESMVWSSECGLEYDETPNLLVSMQHSSTLMDTSLTCSRDAFTTTSDFIISPHSASKGLYIATCGSFHGYKFFPVLGKYVVQMMEGELATDLEEKWAWDRQRPDSSENVEYPNAEMKHLLQPASKL